jgi:hypothetical protein
MRTKLLALFAAALLALSVAAPALASQGPPDCSPGQHGNPSPGFKPGSCDNK